MYREENDQVILTMSREDYEFVMRRFDAQIVMSHNEGYFYEFLVGLLNRLNSGNPNYTPYQVEESK